MMTTRFCFSESVCQNNYRRNRRASAMNLVHQQWQSVVETWGGDIHRRSSMCGSILHVAIVSIHKHYSQWKPPRVESWFYNKEEFCQWSQVFAQYYWTCAPKIPTKFAHTTAAWPNFELSFNNWFRSPAFCELTLNIPSLGRQRCLPSWGPRRTPWFFCNFSTVWCGRLLKLCFWVSETIIQWFKHC